MSIMPIPIPIPTGPPQPWAWDFYHVSLLVIGAITAVLLVSVVTWIIRQERRWSR